MSLFLEYAKRETSKLPKFQDWTIDIDERKKAEADDADNNKKFKNNFVLSEAIDVALSKMVKDAYNDRSKKIPNGFPDFARSE